MEPDKNDNTSRGRGFSRPRDTPRPLAEENRGGEQDLSERLGNVRVAPGGRIARRYVETLRSPRRSIEVRFMCLKDSLEEASNNNQDAFCIDVVIASAEHLSTTLPDMERVFDIIYEFSLRNRKNAVIGAKVFARIGDLIREEVKMKHLLVGKMQAEYEGKESLYDSDKPKFIMNGFFLNEILYSLRFPGDICCEVLVDPAIDYLVMMLEGGSDEEIEVFVEQIPKVYKDFKKLQPRRLDDLVESVRSTIISSSVSEISRARLLQLLELMNNNWVGLDKDTEEFYRRYFHSSHEGFK